MQTAMEELFADVGRQPGVLSVTSPYNEEGAQQVSAQGPEAGLIAYANVDMPSDIAKPTQTRSAPTSRTTRPTSTG